MVSSDQYRANVMKVSNVLTIVMPVHNEARTLRTAVERVLKADLSLPVQLVVVDDCSTDGSAETIADLVDNDHVLLAKHEVNRGKGAAVRTGIAAARGNLLGILDADLEYDPADYEEMLHLMLDEGADIVYGTRTFGSHTAFSFWYVVGNRFISLWASFLYNTWLSDIATCLKLAPTEVWRAADLRSDGFGFDAEATGKFLRAGHRIHETGIVYRARTRAEGKQVGWVDGLRHIWILFWVRIGGGRARRSKFR